MNRDSFGFILYVCYFKLATASFCKLAQLFWLIKFEINKFRVLDEETIDGNLE